jgi:hypothetical protein
MTDEEAGTRVSKILQATDDPRTDDALRIRFKKLAHSDDEYDRGLVYALQKGWVSRHGLYIELTDLGLRV